MRKALHINAMLFLIISVFAAKAQVDTLRSKNLVITTSVLEFFPTLRFNTANVNVGAELYMGGGISLCANGGAIMPYGQPDVLFGISSLRTDGLKVQLECRRYLGRHRIVEPAILLFWPHIFQYHSQTLENTGYCFALHSHFQSTQTQRPETVVDYISQQPAPGQVRYRDNVYSVTRHVFALHLKLGYQCVKRSGFTVDYAVGLGAQYISSSAEKRLGSDSDWPNSQRDLGNKLFDKGVGVAPSAVYKVRLGWAF